MSGDREADQAERDVNELADDLCAAGHDRQPGEPNCQECYDLACQALDTPWLAARLAAVPARDDLAAKVEALAEELPKYGVLRSSAFGPPVETVTMAQVLNLVRALLADPEPDQEQP